MESKYIRVVYGNARLTFVLDDVSYDAVRGPDKSISLFTPRPISSVEYERAYAVAESAFKRMDQGLVNSLVETRG